MGRSWHPDDDELFTELTAAVRGTGTPPDSFVEAAKAAFTWQGIDEELELLSLAFDSSPWRTRACVRRRPASGCWSSRVRT